MMSMPAGPKVSEKRKTQIVVFGGFLLGLALFIAPLTIRGASFALWIPAVLLVGIFGYMIGWGLWFRLTHPSRQERERYREQMLAGEHGNRQAARGFFADRATRDKAAVLRTGVDGLGVVTLIADGRIRRGHRDLVYLELDVTLADGPVYQVRTGEYLSAAAAGTVRPGATLYLKVDPADQLRVAVDWDRCLRLPPSSAR